MHVRNGLKMVVAVFLSAFGLPAQAAHTQARLVLAAETARPGDTVMAAVDLHMDKDWHTYWRNSGQSGLPTTVDWQLPKGVTAGQLQWPVPRKLPEPEQTTYVYENDAALLVKLTLASDLPAGPLTLKARLDWLECQTKCVKEGADVETTLNIGSETKPSKDAAQFAAWPARLPRPGNAVNARAWWEQPGTSDSRSLILEWDTGKASPKEADFFPDSYEKFEIQPMTERLPADGQNIRLRVSVKKLSGDWPKEISGLLIGQSGAERQAYDVKLPVADSGPRVAAATASGGAVISGEAPPLWKIFLYAFIGGLILNVMPCVLPVIALKILGFVSEARNEPGRVRKLGLVYTAGVLCSFLVLALLVLGLQEAGKGAGWGFQFGNPYFLLAMTTLVTLIALNLFGVFEISAGSGVLTTATGLASKQGAAGAFFNGLLATVLATSCSAPFLGAAIGFAFALNKPALTVLIMLMVGIGLAAPYLILSWQPAWLKILPRPGPWMERFKVAMGFPMIAAAAWLCSIAAVHYGDRTWWLVMFLVFVAVAAWIFGEFVQRGRKARGIAALLAVALLGLGYAYALESKLDWRRPISGSAVPTAASKVAPKGLAWQTWSPEAVAESRAAGRPVVIDFTAKWCPTCNTIVKPSFENDAVQKKLKEVNAVLLLADYTLLPDNITAELKRFQRAAVPLVVVYPRRADEPPMIFDLVSPGTLLDALSHAAQQAPSNGAPQTAADVSRR
jgi:thiol:disulfide interchange protein DsbD